jgi:hypothetical protein
LTPREFCQLQLLLLGDEELQPAAQAATLELLHSTIMKDPDAGTFESRLRLLAAADDADGHSVAAAARVAQVLLEAWSQSVAR